MKDKKLKEVHESKLMVRKIVEEGIDPNGRRVIRTQWFESEEPVNLGSLAEPQNKNIVEYKWKVPQENMFTNLFKK